MCGQEHENQDVEAAKLFKQIRRPADPVLQSKMRSLLEQFQRDLDSHPYVTRRSRSWQGFGTSRRWFTIIRIAAGGIAAVLVAAAVLFFSSGTATYAQVSERFRAVPYFHAVIYLREGLAGEPQKYELWMDRGKIRVFTGRQVIFAKEGKIEECFNIMNSSRENPDQIGAMMIQKTGSVNALSLENLISCLVTSDINTPVFKSVSCETADELTIFEKQNTLRGDEKVRIWALQKSKLPLAVRVSSGEHTGYDVFILYSQRQPQRFFDSNDFRTCMQNKTCSPEELVYGCWTDTAEGKK